MGCWNDVFFSGAGRDVIDGGSGIDLVSYADLARGVAVHLGRQTVTGADHDTLKRIESAEGGLGNDRLTGSSARTRSSAAVAMTGCRVGWPRHVVRGADADIFVFNKFDVGSGVDVIMDFELGLDRLDLSGLARDFNLSPSSVHEWLTVAQQGNDTVLTLETAGMQNDVAVIEGLRLPILPTTRSSSEALRAIETRPGGTHPPGRMHWLFRFAC